LIQLLADENIPMETVNLLKKQGIDIFSVAEFSAGLADREILKEAKKNGRILITFDRDFSRLVFKEKLGTKGVILLMFVPKSPLQIARLIQKTLSSTIEIDNQFLTVKEDRVKVTRIK
jgi:predicted nuclease of predicted toxin-antitoxin system